MLFSLWVLTSSARFADLQKPKPTTCFPSEKPNEYLQTGREIGVQIGVQPANKRTQTPFKHERPANESQPKATRETTRTCTTTKHAFYPPVPGALFCSSSEINHQQRHASLSVCVLYSLCNNEDMKILPFPHDPTMNYFLLLDRGRERDFFLRTSKDNLFFSIVFMGLTWKYHHRKVSTLP